MYLDNLSLQLSCTPSLLLAWADCLTSLSLAENTHLKNVGGGLAEMKLSRLAQHRQHVHTRGSNYCSSITGLKWKLLNTHLKNSLTSWARWEGGCGSGPASGSLGGSHLVPCPHPPGLLSSLAGSGRLAALQPQEHSVQQRGMQTSPREECWGEKRGVG